ncbi:DUF4272 domain-containing protein [Danxiaibacter flavus]|uniref:DUF4272 domain-containing protein n=1 Tax=Danxiaibacter flavus TaxID=3049108 RepID=A0ABV3ZPN2_9BACT|nr:DUF4272 domain-containing protein [Chitinophagaceae bacterium DXS]
MTTLKETLQGRKKRIEHKLRMHGISDTSITFLRYLMFDNKAFATPYEVGCRIMILYAIVYAVEEPAKKDGIANWLKNENIWQHIGYKEAEYLEGAEANQEQLNEFSWQLEAAYILAWSLNLVKELPSPSSSATDMQLEDFFGNVAPLGGSIQDFLNNLSYRNPEEIFEENIFYELTTSYFRDLLFNGKEDTTDIDRTAAFERHKALNWLRRFMDIKEWEETDTST